MIEKKPNIVFITIDCLRQDHVGCYGYKTRNTTPFIDSLAKNSFKFNKAYANASFTVSSFIPILFSKMPLDFTDCVPIPEGWVGAQRAVQKEGYTTAGFSSNVFLSKFYGYDNGFDYFNDFFVHNQRTSFIQKLLKKIRKKMISYSFIRKSFLYQFFREMLLKKRRLKKAKLPYAEHHKVTNDLFKWISANKNKPFF